MPSLKPIIVPGSRRKDGTFLVYIRVYHAGASRRLPTSLVCTPADLTRSGRIKNADLLAKADELVRRMRGTLADVSPFDLEDRDVDWIVARIRRGMQGDFRLDFFAFADGYLTSKTATTRRAYTGALGALERYLGIRRLDINDITKSMLQDFADSVEAEPKMHYDRKTHRMVPTDKAKVARGASSRHLAKLAHIFEAAKARYNDEDSGRIPIPRSPFAGIQKTYPPSNGQRNLGPEVMQRLIFCAFRPVCGTFAELRAVRLFVLSFALCGANLADMWEARAGVGAEWRYNRKKTRDRRADRAEMRVQVPAEAVALVDGLQDGPAGWWLPELHQLARTTDTATGKINASLKRWAEREGVEPFTFYAARHTWASLARRAGVEKATIDDALGHRGDFDVTDIYAERAWNLIDEAQRRVLDLFSWTAR